MNTQEQSVFEGWAILELMGHRRLGGYVQEQEIAGHGFLRIDVPARAEDGVEAPIAASQFYSPNSVYCLTPTTEAMARAVADRSQPEPVSRWELPQPKSTGTPGFCPGCQAQAHGGLCRNCGERHPCSCMEEPHRDFHDDDNDA